MYQRVALTMCFAPTVQGLLNDAQFTRYFCLTLAFNFNLPHRLLLDFQCVALLRQSFHFLASNNRIILLSFLPEIRDQPQFLACLGGLCPLVLEE